MSPTLIEHLRPRFTAPGERSLAAGVPLRELPARPSVNGVRTVGENGIFQGYRRPGKQ